MILTFQFNEMVWDFICGAHQIGTSALVIYRPRFEKYSLDLKHKELMTVCLATLSLFK